MKTITDFRAFYDNTLMPELTGLEEERKQTARNVAVLTAAVLLCLLIVSPLLWKSFGHRNPQLMAVLLLVSVFAWFVIYRLLTRGYVRRFKGNIIAKIASFVDPSLRYLPETGIPQSVFTSSSIFTMHPNIYRCEDHIAGKLGATEIECSEVFAQRRVRSGKHTHYHTIFKGLFFIADFNKDFSGNTVVLPDTYEQTFGWVAQAVQSLNFPRGELIKLEDPEFEKLFMVYGTDQVEARYILSTALLRRIMDFRAKTGRTIYMSFTASKMFLAVSRGDNLFEPALLTPILDFTGISHHLEDLEFITGIVDDFNLNTRIWSKQ